MDNQMIEIIFSKIPEFSTIVCLLMITILTKRIERIEDRNNQKITE